MKKTFLLILLSLLLNVIFVNSQWQQTNGPIGGTVLTLLQKGLKIFAGTGLKGIYVSTNNGLSWSQTSQNLLNVNCFASNTNYIFCGTNDGVYRSSDDGLSWVRVFSDIILEISASDSNIYAGTSPHGIYVSSNNGNTWTNRVVDLHIYSMAAQGAEAYACGVFLNPRKLLYSANNGQTWVERPNFNFLFFSILIKDSTIFAGTAGQGVMFSTDKGFTWQQTALNNNYIYSLSAKDNFIFAGSDRQGIFVSSDNGLSWQQSPMSNKCVNKIIVSGNEIFAATNYYGIYKSTDNGYTWLQSNFQSHSISSMSIIDNNIFAGSTSGLLAPDSSNGVYYTQNMGTNWNQILPNKNITVLRSNGSDIFAGTLGGAGLYYSSNNGINWQINNLNLFVVGIDIRDSIIHVGAYNGTGSIQGVFRSTNYGANWNATSLNKIADSFLRKDQLFFASVFGGIYRSTNGGINWVSVLSGPTSYGPLALCGNNIITSSNNGIFLSSDNGQNWIQTFNQRFLTLVVNQDVIFAGSSNNFFVSINNGYNWIQKNEGLNGVGISSICIYNGYILAGTVDNSVWKRSLTEIIGINMISQIIPETYYLSQNYPNPFNPQTKIKFDVPANVRGQTSNLSKLPLRKAGVKLVIYDLLGREVATLVNEELKPGTYEADWDASNFSSGVYFYKIISEGFVETKKMVLMK